VRYDWVAGYHWFAGELRVMNKANSNRIDGHQSNGRTSFVAMKARQCSKIAELRQVLLQAGYLSLNQQAVALGLSRSTTWAILQAMHKTSGLSGSVIKRMLRSRELPPEARQWIEEYVAERLAGAYGHNNMQLRVFRAQVELPTHGVVLDIQPQPAPD
jgi:hypothetical protein